MRLRPWDCLIPPQSEVTKADTGLRFTDVLFGFVIKELFVRLQNWSHLAPFIRWQLIAATVLVLGSWIGFRRSLNRSSYELKFFNIPLFRFLMDQTMVFLYFKIATLTPPDLASAQSVHVDHVTHETIKIVLLIFALYAVWDLLGIVMTWGDKYPKVDEHGKKQPEFLDGVQRPEWENTADVMGFAVTGLCLALSAVLYFVWVDGPPITAARATLQLAAATAVLIVYRWFKEIRSTQKAHLTL